MRPVEFRDQDVYVCESWAPGSTSVGAADTSTAMEDVTAAMELETLQNLSPSTSLTADLPPPQPVVRSFKLIVIQNIEQNFTTEFLIMYVLL